MATARLEAAQALEDFERRIQAAVTHSQRRQTSGKLQRAELNDVRLATANISCKIVAIRQRLLPAAKVCLRNITGEIEQLRLLVAEQLSSLKRSRLRKSSGFSPTQDNDGATSLSPPLQQGSTIESHLQTAAAEQMEAINAIKSLLIRLSAAQVEKLIEKIHPEISMSFLNFIPSILAIRQAKIGDNVQAKMSELLFFLRSASVSEVASTGSGLHNASPQWGLRTPSASASTTSKSAKHDQQGSSTEQLHRQAQNYEERLIVQGRRLEAFRYVGPVEYLSPPFISGLFAGL